MNDNEMLKNMLDSYKKLYPDRAKLINEAELIDLRESENEIMIQVAVKANEYSVNFAGHLSISSLSYLFDMLSFSLLLIKNIYNSTSINLDLSYNSKIVNGEKLNLTIYCKCLDTEFIMFKLEARNQEGEVVAVGTHNILTRHKKKSQEKL